MFPILFSFIFGLCFGSFLNALIYRLHEKKTLLDRSVCPFCQHKLSWFENIPLFSFIFLKGKCQYCQRPISIQYPLNELLMGIFFVISFNYQNLFSGIRINTSLPDSVSSCFYAFIFFALLFIFTYDLKYQEIEFWVVWPAIALSFFYNFLNKQPLNSLLISMAVGAGFFLAQYLLTKGKGIGLGDVWIGLFLGSLFSLKILIVALFLSYVIGAIFCLLLLIFKKAKLKTKIPLAPFLVIGSLVAIFFGQTIVNFYFNNFLK